MVAVLAAVRLGATNGVPADDVVNDFAFDMATFTSGDADDIAAALESFYNTVQVIPGVDARVASYLSETLSRGTDACTIDLYNLTGHLDGTPHGSPTFTRSFTLEAAGSVGSLPAECAVALSFHGDLDGVLERSGGTRPAARRRGRVFLGPLIPAAGAMDGGSELRVATDCRDTICAAATSLQLAVDNGWSVWSRADLTLYGVVGGWVDNSFDVQRRRGPDFTIRTIWP